MIEQINRYELNISATYREYTDSGTSGESIVTYPIKTGAQYSDMRVKRMSPPRTSESYENMQVVSENKDTFKIEKCNREFNAKDVLEIDSEYYHIVGIRPSKGSINFMLLDTVKKDHD